MISFFTFQDVIDHAVDYLGGNVAEQVRRDCIRAALESYRDLANAFNWSYFYTHGRIVTSGAFDGSAVPATVQYLQSSGTYDQQLTISGGTWPAWAGSGTYIRLGIADDFGVSNQVAYRVKERKSATVLTLTDSLNPGVDLPAGTQFILYRDTYLLPEDYIAQDQALYERNFGGMEFTHPRDWLFENRYVFAQGVPSNYTVTGDQQYPGRLVMRLYPWPSETKTVDFVYKRRPRPLLLAYVTQGTVSVSSGSQSVTGVGTGFTPGMVGSALRIASSGTKPPLSLIMGETRPVFESIVTSWTSATSITIADPADIAYSAAPYAISDTVDIEAGAMLNAYLRCVEKHIGMSRTLKDKPSAAKQYLDALGEARSADSRSFTGRSVSQNGPLRRRLRDYPIDLSHTE